MLICLLISCPTRGKNFGMVAEIFLLNNTWVLSTERHTKHSPHMTWDEKLFRLYLKEDLYSMCEHGADNIKYERFINVKEVLQTGLTSQRQRR